jgi:hypothetical protein
MACGAQLPPMTQKPPLSPFAKFLGCGVLALIGGGLILSIAIIALRPAPTDPIAEFRPVARAEPEPPTIDALDLLAAYDANEIRADATYKGKLTYVTGTVQDIGTDILGAPYLTFGEAGSFARVQAMFDRKDAQRLASISKGQTARVRCTISGKTLTNIIGRNCLLL